MGLGSTKKKKEKKKDFAKAKLKLGKGKQKAANATDVSFASRSIALGQQSIGREHDEGVPTTKRNQSLEDLQNHLKHHNLGTRKDALVGLRELLTSYPGLAYSSISTLLPLLARSIGDESPSFRTALLAFLDVYLRALPAAILQPYHSILIFFTTTSLSHIYPDVRMDAVRALNLLLDVCPEAMALDWSAGGSSPVASTSASSGSSEQSHSMRVLECYLALLHVRSGIVTNGLRTDMSPAHKALVLSSLGKFLHVSLDPEGRHSGHEDDRAVPAVPTWFLRSSFATERDYHAFVARFEKHGRLSKSQRRPAWTQDMSLAPEDASRTLAAGRTDLLCGAEGDKVSLASISDISSLLRAEGTTASASISVDPAAGAVLPSNAQELLRTVLPILVSAFLDTAPTALSPSSALGASSTIGTLSHQSYSSASSASSGDVALDTVCAVTGIARDLWRAILSSSTAGPGGSSAELRKGLEKYVTHMAAYFPFGSDEIGARRTGAQIKKLQDLNIAYCELVALLYLAATATATQGNGAAARMGAKSASAQLASSKLVLQLESVQRYVSALLSHSANPLASIGTPTVSQNLNPHAYAQLLPTIWSLLLAESGSRSQENQGDIFVTMVRHSIALSAGSGTKKLATGFMSRNLLMQDTPSYVGGFSLPLLQRRRPEIAGLLDEWLLSLPRYLWELGSNDVVTSQLIVNHLRAVLISDGLSTSPPETRTKLSSFLVPYFFSHHSARGDIPGPFVRLADRRLQRAVLEMAWWYIRTDEGSDASTKLLHAVGQAVVRTQSEELGAVWAGLLGTSAA